MKILEQVDVDAWRQEVRCGKCETKMEIEWVDLHSESYSDRNESAVTCFHINCPVCRTKINIITDSIPKAVQIEVLETEKGEKTRRSKVAFSNASQWDNGRPPPWQDKD